MYRFYNPNPVAARVGDCAIRAIAKATGQSWEKVFDDLCKFAFDMADLPNANNVWGAYLRSKGYKRFVVSPDCPDCYTVRRFAFDNPHGTFVLSISGHVVCVKDGDYYDTYRRPMDDEPLGDGYSRGYVRGYYRRGRR